MWRRWLLVMLLTACAPSAPTKTQPAPRPITTSATIANIDASSGAMMIETTDDAGAVRPGARCSITLRELISADVFRGEPRSPARDDAYSRLDPKTQSEWDGRDHGLLYLSCVYAVVMNGSRYKFQHIAGHGFMFSGERDELDPKQCSSTNTRDEATASIRKSTQECEDPHHGAYWGFDLVPLP